MANGLLEDTRCATCAALMELVGTGTMALGDADGGLISEGDVYICAERHVWVNCAPPVWMGSN